MKTPSEDLFKLIKSLTGKEKQYFKINAHKFSTTIYLFLFDFIGKMTFYDEGLVKRAMKKEKFNGSFKSIKKYLLETLLKFLNEFHYNLNISVQLNNLIVSSEILIDKGLYELALKQLNKAKIIADQHDQYEFLVKIISLKRNIYIITTNVKNIEEFLINDSRENRLAIKKLENYIDYNTLGLEINFIHSSGLYDRNKKLQERVTAVLENPLMKSPDKALSFDAMNQYYYIHLVSSILIRKNIICISKEHRLINSQEAGTNQTIVGNG